METRVNKVLNILESFKYSINIKDDYLNNEKIRGFFPTYKTTHRLIKFINGINSNNNGSLLLSGAYGTGKSFQIAVLLAILTSKENKIDFDTLLKKMQIEEKIITDISNSIKMNNYLIVFPDDYFSDFKQAIVMGILDSINQHRLEINLNTNYNVITQKILNWKKNYTYVLKMFEKELESKNITIQNFLHKIEEHDQNYYKIFEEIYPQIMGGDKFTPYDSLINIAKIITDFEQQVCKQGYDGVIYVFDEYGRYLEENIHNINVKQVQDVAEYCNAKNNSNLILISHKDLFQYSYRLRDEHLRSEWEKVSGRFYKEHLYYEENNVFEMINKILSKTDSFEKFTKDNAEFFITQKFLFEEYSPEADMPQLETIYPLNYISLLLLPSLSQKLAQNERTLFSFLCGDEELSLKNIFNNQDENPHLITPDYLYDYFNQNFNYFDIESTEYRTYLTSKELVKRVSNVSLKKLIKIIAVIFINNDFERIKPNYATLNLAFGKEQKLFDDTLSILIKQGFIVHKRHLDHFILKTEFEVNVDLEVENYIKNELGNVNYIEILEHNIPLEYEYSIQYNNKFHVTRFFSKHYINSKYENEFIGKNYCDGIIHYLVPLEISELQEFKIDQSNSNILIIPSEPLKISKELKILESINRIATGNLYHENNSAKQELMKYKLEMINIIKESIHNAFKNFHRCKIYVKNILTDINTEIEFQEVCSKYLEKKFKNFIPINYELINKNNISSPMKKSRIEILRKLKSNEITEEFFYKTGSENSVARIILLNSNIYNLERQCLDFENSECLFKEIYKTIEKKLKKRSVCFNDLYFEFTSSDSSYGFRKGIFTFLLALICELRLNQVYISNKGNELTISPEIFDKIEKSPEKYEIGIIKYSDSENSFLDNLANKYKVLIDSKMYEENKSLAVFSAFRRWLLSLPKLVINSEFKENDNLLSIIRGIAINNSKEFFFRKLPSIYNTSDFEIINKSFINDVDILEQMSSKIEKRIESEIKDVLQLSDKPFEEALTEWSKKAKNDKNSKDYNEHLFEWLVYNTETPINNKNSFLKFFSEKIQGFDYYNWISENSFDDFSNKLKIVVGKQKKISIKRSTTVEMKTLEKLLKTKLEQDLRNFGTSMTNEEKKNILAILYSEIDS